MSTTQQQFENDAIRELLAKQLSDEKRDHAETLRQLNSANRKIEGLERLIKGLASDVDRKDQLLINTSNLIKRSIELFDQLAHFADGNQTEI